MLCTVRSRCFFVHFFGKGDMWRSEFRANLLTSYRAFAKLPNEMEQQIAHKLKIKDLNSLAAVNKPARTLHLDQVKIIKQWLSEKPFEITNVMTATKLLLTSQLSRTPDAW